MYLYEIMRRRERFMLILNLFFAVAFLWYNSNDACNLCIVQNTTTMGPFVMQKYGIYVRTDDPNTVVIDER